MYIVVVLRPKKSGFDLGLRQ